MHLIRVEEEEERFVPVLADVARAFRNTDTPRVGAPPR
jgi:hypothetical protein